MSLWGTVQASPSAIPPPTNPASALNLASVGPGHLVSSEVDREQAIEALVPQVVTVVEYSQKLCASAFELAQYVPPNLDADPHRKKLWSEVIIPKLVASMVDDVKASNCLESSLSAIYNLGTTINENAALIRDTQGSAAAIEVAQQQIGKSVAQIKANIAEIEGCKSTAIQLFSENAGAILEIVGPKAADFAAQEAEQQDIIRAANHRIQEAINERSKVVAEVEKYINLMHTIEVSISGQAAAITATMAREASLKNLINETESKVNTIPTHTTKNETTYTHHPGHYPYSWWGWRRCWYGSYTTSQTHQVQVANPDRDAQVNYYSGIINAREARRKEALKEKETEQQRLQALNDQKAEYQAGLTRANNQLKNEQGEGLNKITEDIIKQEDERIKVAADKILSIRNLCDQTENLIGMKGSVLLECLSSIRNFAAAGQAHLKLWQPLISVLEHVLSNVESSVLLLQKDPNSVFVAGIRLLKNVSLFHGTVRLLRDQTSSERHKKILENVRAQGLLTAK